MFMGEEETEITCYSIAFGACLLIWIFLGFDSSVSALVGLGTGFMWANILGEARLRTQVVRAVIISAVLVAMFLGGAQTRGYRGYSGITAEPLTYVFLVSGVFSLLWITWQTKKGRERDSERSRRWKKEDEEYRRQREAESQEEERRQH